MSTVCSGMAVSACISKINASATFSATSILFGGMMGAAAFIFVLFVIWKQYGALGPDKVTFWGFFTSIIQAIFLAFALIAVVNSII